MRVVAGTARGRKLVAPKGLAVRPTSDRVREAIFNSLESIDVVRGARAIDLFAGTGAMGIEALSRGAEHVTFVDNDHTAVRTIDANLRATAFAERATVVRDDVLDHLRTAHKFDLAFADPPYAFTDWGELLAHLNADVVVLESDRALTLPATYELLKEKAYGGTVVVLARLSGSKP